MCLFTNVLLAELHAIFCVKNTFVLRLNSNILAQVSHRHKHFGQILKHDKLTWMVQKSCVGKLFLSYAHFLFLFAKWVKYVSRFWVNQASLIIPPSWALH